MLIEQSETHIGLFNWSGFVKSVVFARHPLTKTRIFLIRLGRLKIELFNYTTRPLLQIKHASSARGILILNARLTLFLRRNDG